MNVHQQNGRWRAVLYLGTVDGKPQRKQFGAKTREAAVAKLEAAKKKYHRHPRGGVRFQKRPWMSPEVLFVAYARVGDRVYEGYGPTRYAAERSLLDTIDRETA